MKILHISAYKNGGAGIAAWRLHKAMLERGIESRFLSFEKRGDPEQAWFTYAGSGYGFWWRLSVKLRLIYFNHFSGHETKWAKIKKQVKAEFISYPFTPFSIHNHPLVKWADVIHLHWVSPILDYPVFFKYNKKPVAWTLHDLNPLMGIFHYVGDKEKNKHFLWEDELTQVKRNAYLHKKFPLNWIMLSTYFNNYAYSYGLSEGDIKFICNVAPLDTFKPMDKVSSRKKLLPGVNGTIFLMAASDIGNFRKGGDLLEKALPEISEPYSLVLIGNAPKDREGIPGIYYTGFISNPAELAEWYALSDAVIIPSREDNLPNVMLEALSSGLPVMGFRIGGLIDHIKDEVTGLLAEYPDAHLLAKAINDFLSNKNLYDSNLIRSYAESSFGAETIIDGHIAVYRELIEQ